MFQESELINLVLAVFAVSIVSTFFLRRNRQYRFFYLGFALIVSALVFTVAEGIAYHHVFNLLEHLCYALAGLVFLLACRNLRQSAHAEETGQ